MTNLAGRRVLHLTTTDISLALLLGPQLRAFADAGMEVIGASAPGPWVGDLEASGIRHEAVVHATRSMSVRKDALALAELVRLFRRVRPDIVHTHNPKPGIYGRLAARLAGVPVVLNTVHGLFAAPDDAFMRKAIVYGLERFATACCQAEMVLNAEDLTALRRTGIPERKLVMLGGGVDVERFRPRSPSFVTEARKALGFGDDRVIVGLVARLVWEKGLRELFAAAEVLRQTMPEVVVVVVGPSDSEKSDGLRPADLRAAEALGNVVFLGERRDVEALYPAFDLFALPSYREGLPLSAMEASACGVPVVATDIRGCRQVVHHGVTGLLVPVRDAGALVDAIGSLARDRGRRQAMGQAARRRAEAEFDQRRVVSDTLKIYSRLLDPVGSPQPLVPRRPAQERPRALVAS